ncbi:universal stress protein [Gymnodinialimonas sp. 2305UL16-5]|uniref:universal stress protein n=1 Tax=Gymnodinialimonas mytili TaxID=3126503 RepID=UPI0030A47583
MFKTIVVAIDGSAPSQHALDTASKLAVTFDADLHLVHSPQIETTMIAVGYSVMDVPITPERIAEAGASVMDAALASAKDAGCTKVNSTIGSGDATDDILDAAKLNDADLIVMGRRGLGSIASVLMGSVSQKVAHGASCSVLTVN